jgi:hypothetical protein
MVMDADDAARAAAAAIHARKEVVGSVVDGLKDVRIRLARAAAAAAAGSRHAGEHRHASLGQVAAAERVLRLGTAAVGDAGVAAGLGGTIADPAAGRGRNR